MWLCRPWASSNRANGRPSKVVPRAERYKDDHFDAVFTSDLARAYRSAEIGFGNRWPIIRDKRLRECDYGDLTQKPSDRFMNWLAKAWSPYRTYAARVLWRVADGKK